jgi:hypothetical protein
MKRILIASALAFAAGGQALAADLPPRTARRARSERGKTVCLTSWPDGQRLPVWVLAV